MSLVRLVSQRLALGVVTIVSTLSVVFAMFTATEDYFLERIVAQAAYEGASAEELERLREEFFARRGTDRPLLEQYVDWMSNMLTFQWGRSFTTGEKVTDTIVGATITTGSYILPALVLATVLALVFGVYTAMQRETARGGLLRSVAYLGLGVPYFWLGGVVFIASGAVALNQQLEGGISRIRPAELPFLYETVVPACLVTVVLLPAILSYARAYSIQYVAADTTRLVRAKGGGQLAVARHVLRNAAIPLVSLVFTETLALLAIAVFAIEVSFGMDGLGFTFYNAVWTRNLPIMLGGVFVIIVFGTVANLLQDLAYSALDPRVDTGTR